MHSHLWGAWTSLFFLGHRLQTLMTRATVEDSTAGLGQTLRTGRLLVGGLSLHGLSGLCLSWTHGLPGGIRAQGMRRRTIQAWVSCSGRGGGRATACDPHAVGGDQCGEQHGDDDVRHRAVSEVRLCILTSFREPLRRGDGIRRDWVTCHCGSTTCSFNDLFQEFHHLSRFRQVLNPCHHQSLSQSMKEALRSCCGGTAMKPSMCFIVSRSRPKYKHSSVLLCLRPHFSSSVCVAWLSRVCGEPSGPGELISVPTSLPAVLRRPHRVRPIFPAVVTAGTLCRRRQLQPRTSCAMPAPRDAGEPPASVSPSRSLWIRFRAVRILTCF